MSSNVDTAEKSISFSKNIFERRVPHAFGIYVGASWGIIQFVEWMTNRYVLSPHLVNFGIVILLSMIPSVLFLAYYHGKPGRDQWTKVEKIGIPTNVIFTATLLFFLFNGKDLGATSTTVTLEDEGGNKIERVIPKSEFRKKIALFFFDNKSDDPELDWLQYGFPLMLNYDLFQDLFIQSITPHELGFTGTGVIYKEMKDAGFVSGVGIPLTLKKKIADDLHMKYFVSGEIEKHNEGFLIKTSLHETKSGKLITENTLDGNDIFKLVDEISVQLKQDLEIPAGHIEKVNDLPVSEILTNSISAAKFYTLGFNAKLFDQSWQNAQQYLEKSVEEDPTFASAYLQLQVIYALTNQSEKRVQVFQPLMQHLYKLPERIQYYAKANYYEIRQEPDKQFAVIKMIVNLYPDDIQSRSVLAIFYNYRNQLDESITEYKRILEIDPEQHAVLLEIGSLHTRKGELEEALKYYKQYADQFPENPESFTAIGGVYLTLGDYDQAKTYYEKALLIEPDKIPYLLALAEIESISGNFEKAIAGFQGALKVSKSPKDLFEVHKSLAGFYELKGQMSKSLEHMRLKFNEMEKFESPIAILRDKAKDSYKYIKANQKDKTFQIIKDIEAKLNPPFDKIISLGYLNIYLELEDPDNTEKAIEGVEALIQAFRVEVLRPEIIHAQGRIHEMRGEYEQAILSYQKELELRPTRANIKRNIARCYRKLKDYGKAKDYMQEVLKIHPFGPVTNYEMALLYLEEGDKQKALEHLKTALEIWKDADPEYKPAKEAREKLATIEQQT